MRGRRKKSVKKSNQQEIVSDLITSQLPAEMLLLIFSFLTIKDLVFYVGLTCKYFRALSEDNSLWRPFWHMDTEEKNYKAACRQQIILRTKYFYKYDPTFNEDYGGTNQQCLFDEINIPSNKIEWKTTCGILSNYRWDTQYLLEAIQAQLPPAFIFANDGNNFTAYDRRPNANFSFTFWNLLGTSQYENILQQASSLIIAVNLQKDDRDRVEKLLEKAQEILKVRPDFLLGMVGFYNKKFTLTPKELLSFKTDQIAFCISVNLASAKSKHLKFTKMTQVITKHFGFFATGETCIPSFPAAEIAKDKTKIKCLLM